jgi:hypothetical protein
MRYSDFDNLSIEEKLLSLTIPKNIWLDKWLLFSNWWDCNNWSLLYNEVLTKLKVKHSIVALPNSEHSFIKWELNWKHFIVDVVTDARDYEEGILLGWYREINIWDNLLDQWIITKLDPLEIKQFHNDKNIEFWSFWNNATFIRRIEKIGYSGISIEYKREKFAINNHLISISWLGRVKYYSFRNDIVSYINKVWEENFDIMNVIKIIYWEGNNKLNNKDTQKLIWMINKKAFLNILNNRDSTKLNVTRKF